MESARFISAETLNMSNTFASSALNTDQAQLISSVVILVIAVAHAVVLTRTLPKPRDAAFRA